MDYGAGINAIIAICQTAWREGFMAGWSGNASIRLDDGGILVTAAGAPKGRLSPEDCLLADDRSNSRKPSSETGMHLEIYKKAAVCSAILHTHPPYLQALNLALARGTGDSGETLAEKFLNLPLYEATVWRKRLYFSDDFPPGSKDLAHAAANSLPLGPEFPCAIWLELHGLCALGKNLEDALCLTEELEHLAMTQLLARY